ncbi:MAG: hypothetical protein GY873_39260, partial [Bosea sp.]|uniref:hypothetical protein n=1 Tax=Bosea sp. (in: a-proteobacteria) TaxID=1871050 RepID=UPI0023A280F2|nr:hypothetical protein [Bosea sp. (in: a-proteobacteria)]
TAVVSNPKLDLEEGRYYVPMHKRSSGRSSALLFAPTWHSDNAYRKVFENMGHEVTKDVNKTMKLVGYCELAFVENVTAFLNGFRTCHAWAVRVLGAGVVDTAWMEVVRSHRRLPPPIVAFQGLRRPRFVFIDKSFEEEHGGVVALLRKAMATLPVGACAWKEPALRDTAPKSVPTVRLVGMAEKSERVAKAKAKAKAFARGAMLSRIAGRGRGAAPAAPSSAAPKPQHIVWSADELWKELSSERMAATTLK